MSSAPSRIELTCEFIPSILSGPIGFATFVYYRHLFRIGFVLRVGSGRYETRPNGSSSWCAVQPRPAVCSEAQRPERPPRAVGIHGMPPVSQRPGRLEGSRPHHSSHPGHQETAMSVLIKVDLVAVVVFHHYANAVGTDFGFAFELDAALF